MNQLEDRLASLLARSGAAIEVRPDLDRVRDAGRPVDHEVRDDRGDRGAPARSRRHRLAPAAALIVVVALAGAAAVAVRTSRDGNGTSDPEPADIVTVGDPPDGWLVPAWVPDGMQPWTVDWGTTPGTPPTVVPQLFGDPDEGRAIFVSESYEVRADLAREVAVRGRTGKAGPSWNVEEKDMGDAIAWDERGTTLTALYKGMNTDEAIAALDALVWRTDDPADGFAPPSGDASVPLRAEASRRPPDGHDATLVYSDGPPDGTGDRQRPGLEVHTSTGDTLPGRYLEAWYEQGRAAGGGERPLTSVDEGGRRLSVLWPDGRSIDISTVGAARAGSEVLQQVADSLTVATEADMATRRDDAEAATAALPVVASAATRIGTVEVHGDGGFFRLCLVGAVEPAQPGPSCPVDGFGGGSSDDGTAIVTAEWTIDGTWSVVVASTGEPPQIVGGHDPSSSPDSGELPADTATSGDWTIRLVQPARGIAQVCTSTPVAVACAHTRPG